jgi:ABC-type transporter Mla subunit MlaD
MGSDKKPRPEIVLAAEALEEELARTEAMSQSLRRIRLDGEKNLDRAADELGQVLALPERIGERLRSLSTAMAHLQARQQAALEPLATFATYVQQRRDLFAIHMQTFAQLGHAAGELSAALGSGGTNAASLGEADRRLQEIVDRARALFEAARDDDFPSIAREADVLKQRMAALRKRLLLAS